MSLVVRTSSLIMAVSIAMFAVKFAEKFQVDIKDLSGKIELVGLLLLVLLAGRRLLRLPKQLLLFLALFGAAMLLGLANVRGMTVYGIGQLILNLKFPLALVLGYALATSDLISKEWDRWLIYAVVIAVPLVIFELTASGVYRAIFPATLTDTVITGTNIQRATGWFIHPGPFGIFCSICLLYIFSISKYLTWNTTRRIGAVAGFICLIASGQRQESLAVIMVLIGGYILTNRRGPLPIMFGFLIMILFLIFGFDFLQEIYTKTSANLSFDLAANEMAPRLLLLRGAGILANYYFPFGSGLGTYGGSMSAVNPQQAYDLAEISSVWWFGQASFLTDTYWAMPFGELGWLGGGLLLFAHIYLIAAVWRRYLDAGTTMAKLNAQLAIGLLAFALIDSVGAPIYTGSTLTLLLIAVPAGYSFSTSINGRGV